MTLALRLWSRFMSAYDVNNAISPAKHKFTGTPLSTAERGVKRAPDRDPVMERNADE